MEKKQGNKNNDAANTQISVRLSNELLKLLEDYGKAERRSRGNAIEYLLWQVLKEKRDEK